MAKKRTFLIIQSVFCVLTAIALIAADLSIYFEGKEIKLYDPMADIYTVEAVAARAVWVVPLLLFSILITIIGFCLGAKDENADRPVLKVDIKNNSAEGGLSVTTVNVIRAVLLVLAIAFIVIGIFNGSMSDVLIKASKICTECIGLG